jgi:hypothetical protein
MARNVDLMRFLVLQLKRRERSPVEPIFLPLEDLAAQSGSHRDDVLEALHSLSDADFIEGPGPYQDQWIFRKLTHRGDTLHDLVSDEKEWRKVKEAYGILLER